MSLSLPFEFRPDIFSLPLPPVNQGGRHRALTETRQELQSKPLLGLNVKVSACVCRLGSLCPEDKGEPGRGIVRVLGNSKGTRSRLFSTGIP